VVLDARLAVGVNVAVLPMLAYVTSPATAVVPGPAKVNVIELIVAALIALLKVALTVSLSSTFIAKFAGIVETTVGFVVSGAAAVVNVQM
jgi:hypothetical protein